MAGFRLYGRPAYTRRSVRVLLMVTLHVMLKRAIRKSLVPGWNFTFEVGTRFLAKQMKYALSLSEIKDAREYFDSLVFDPLSPVDVAIRESEADQLKGRWFIPNGKESGRTMLYFHGGGYAFYPKSHLELIALLADAANAATFALDYRLTPEHSYPAQLQDAVAAYRQLLASGVDPSRLVIAGDSAGGHLVMMTLFALRDAGLPLPALAIGICPWMDIGRRAQRPLENDRYDWVQEHMALKFGDWLKGNTGLSDTDLSPICGDLRGLCPIYLQAGGKEVLFDMIRDFASVAKEQGAQVTLDVWPSMNHDFQAYGTWLPESLDALIRIGAVVEHYCAKHSE